MSLLIPVPKPFAGGFVGSDERHYVSGPISGCGYDSGTLYPSMRLSSEADTHAAAAIANAAFEAGAQWARRQIRESLGMGE